MNRADWRQKILEQRSWQFDTDTAAVAEANRQIDTALKRLATDAPGAFVPDEEKVVLLPDKTHTDLGRYLTATTDTRVLSFGATGTVNPTVDGTWDGLYHLEVKDEDGTWHRRQSREFWLQAGGAYDGQYLVSLDRPWRNTTDKDMEFRLHQPEIYTTDDVTRVLDGRVWDDNRSQIVVVPEHHARMWDDEDFRGTSKGRPEYLFRARHFQLDAPNRAPQVAVTGEGGASWLGPEPPGAFTYVFTYVWGKRDAELVDPDGNSDPLWESSPSPASASITTTGGAGQAITLTLPKIDWELNFAVSGTVRASRSGVRMRVYRARTTVTGTAPTYEVTIERPDVYQLLTEVDGATTTYTDNGTVIPGYYRRLPESHGYYAWKVAPHQDQRYEIDLRVFRNPRRLLNDYDAPRVHPAAESMLLELALHYLCRAQKQYADAAVHLGFYKDQLDGFRSEFSNPARVIPATPWSPGGTRITDPFRYGRFTS